jgi:hypothetical protein
MGGCKIVQQSLIVQVQVLLKAGADATRVERDGRDVAEHAIENRHLVVGEFIRNYIQGKGTMLVCFLRVVLLLF